MFNLRATLLFCLFCAHIHLTKCDQNFSILIKLCRFCNDAYRGFKSHTRFDADQK